MLYSDEFKGFKWMKHVNNILTRQVILIQVLMAGLQQRSIPSTNMSTIIKDTLLTNIFKNSKKLCTLQNRIRIQKNIYRFYLVKS